MAAVRELKGVDDCILREIEKGLKLPFAHSKAAAVATSRELAVLVTKHVGPQAGGASARPDVRKLGYDYGLGRRGAKVRRGRLDAGSGRLHRIARLRAPKHSLRRIMAAGPTPAALFGAEMSGAPPIAMKAYDARCARLCGALALGGSAGSG